MDKPLALNDDMDIPRSTFEETIAFIEKDIDEAERIFSTTTFVDNTGSSPLLIYSPETGWNPNFSPDVPGSNVSNNNGRPDLGAILTYHVVAGKLMAADVVAAINAGGGTATVDTVNGAAITVELVGGDVVINGTATVIQTDLEADNGVVHVIDAVLLPPAN